MFAFENAAKLKLFTFEDEKNQPLPRGPFTEAEAAHLREAVQSHKVFRRWHLHVCGLETRRYWSLRRFYDSEAVDPAFASAYQAWVLESTTTFELVAMEETALLNQARISQSCKPSI